MHSAHKLLKFKKMSISHSYTMPSLIATIYTIAKSYPDLPRISEVVTNAVVAEVTVAALTL